VNDTGGALCGLSALVGPVAADLGVPHLRGGGAQVLDEVLGGARLVGAVNGGDRLVGQGGIRVLGDDRVVTPIGDFALEDLRDGRCVEVQGVDAVQVEDDRDRRDVRRDLDDRAARNAGGEVVFGEFLILEGTVGAGERVGARDEVVAAGARPGRVVFYGHVGVG